MIPIPCVARILVVDNDPRVQRDLKEILSHAGHRVEVAQGSGAALLASAKAVALKFRPHVVIMDLRLLDDESDDRSGLDLLKEQAFSSAGCILHSAYLQDFRIIREAFHDVGVDDVVGKAESLERLLKAVHDSARKGCACTTGLHFEWPTAWNPERVVEALFDAESDVPADMVNDILGRLFPDAQPLFLQTLGGAAVSPLPLARGRSVLLQAKPDDRVPVIVKLAPQDRTLREVAAYESYVQDRLGGLFYARKQAHAIFWDLGGICYSFIGPHLKAVNTFAAFYSQQEDPEVIVRPLRHFFNEVWRDHYQNSRTPLQGTLFEAYDHSLKLRHRLSGFLDQYLDMRFTGVDIAFPDPVGWVLRHEADSRVPSAFQSVTHGDLHGDNLFTDGEFAWAIDFERTGEGPILRDFVELEQDIITRLAAIPEDDWPLFCELAVALSTPSLPNEPLPIGHRLRASKEARKALKTIELLRQQACETTRYQDMREYYWGLLLDALVGSSLADMGSTKQRHGLFLAAVLCSRLQHWDKSWPPPGWPWLSEASTLARDEPLDPSGEYDAFLSYNSRDQAAVHLLAQRLKDAGVSIWLDQWNFLPGDQWQEEIEDALIHCKCYVAFWGPSGMGPWHHEEMRLAVSRRVKEGLRIIPILLPGCADPKDMPPLLQRTSWADFRQGLDSSTQMKRLIAGISAAAADPGQKS